MCKRFYVGVRHDAWRGSVARTKSGMRGAAECIRTNITMTKKARVLERLEP